MKTIIPYLLSCLLLVAGLIACTDEMTEPLAAAFSSDLQEIVVGESVTFRDESTGSPSRWNWQFEGGTPETSILFSPSVAYETPGTYRVQLMVGRGDDSVEIVQESYIKVNHPSVITVDFMADKTIATNEDLITFEDRSVGYPTEWLWEFTNEEGLVTSSSEQHPALTFEPGIYTVKLTATNPNTSASATKEEYLTIIDKYSVAANFAAEKRNTYAGGSVQFHDISSGNATAWLWEFEGGTPATSTEQHPQVSYANPGRYRVTLTASNDVNSSTIAKEAYLSVIPGEDLVMYFPFDGDSIDAGPNQLTPALLSQGGVEILFNGETRYNGVDAEGRAAAVFQSNDINNYAILSVPESEHLNFGSSDFTVAFWVKVPPITRNHAVYHHGSGPGARPDNENRQSWFRFQPSNQYVRFVVEQKGKAGNWVDYTQQSMTDDQWHHFVCIYKEVDGRKDGYMYIDGELKVSNLGKHIKTIDGTPYYIGCNYRYLNGNFNPENFLNGMLDDYILYNRALSDEEARALYNY